MNLDDPEDRDVAAAEFVTGTLAGDDRARFEATLATDADLQRAVYAWQDRLVDLARLAPPVEPAPTLWRRIDERLVAAVPTPASRGATTAANEPLWNRLVTWRAATGAAIAASLVLAVVAFRGGSNAVEPADRYLAVLQSPAGKDTGWIVEATAGTGVKLVPVGPAIPPPPGKSLQFWTKPDGANGPTSLGLVRPGEVVVVPLARLPALGERQLFEVTLEPEGGSPIGKPTGPVLYVGTTVHL